MDDNQIWKEIQNSMAISGYQISDKELERIKTEYENSNEDKMVEEVLKEVGLDAPFEVHKKAWERIRAKYNNE